MKTVALLLLASSLVRAQPKSPSVQTTGTCSPVVPGSGNTLKITCSGLTATQNQLLTRIPALLNKLLAAQTDNTAEILAKLDSCVAQSAPRAISADQRRRIIEALSNPPSSPEISIRATNSTAESSRYASQLQAIFASIPGWNAPPVFENMVAGMALPVGLTAYVQSDKNVYGINIQRLFKELNISISFAIDPSMRPETIVLVVGQKPVE
jgi:hypothetical protein